jgi:hypothetical protein
MLVKGQDRGDQRQIQKSRNPDIQQVAMPFRTQSAPVASIGRFCQPILGTRGPARTDSETQGVDLEMATGVIQGAGPIRGAPAFSPVICRASHGGSLNDHLTAITQLVLTPEQSGPPLLGCG